MTVCVSLHQIMITSQFHLKVVLSAYYDSEGDLIGVITTISYSKCLAKYVADVAESEREDESNTYVIALK